MRWLILAVAIASLCGAGASASAQTYPSRPITVIVPFPAGGPTDAIVRILGERMRVSLGQPLVVEYVTGGTGTIGVGRAARAAPDGHTLLIGHLFTNVISPAFYPLTYDVVKDFAPVARLPSNPFFLVAKNSVPAKNLSELIAWVKANQQTVSFGTPGANSLPHIAGIAFQSMTGTRFPFVPYRGAAPAMQDLIAGQIDLMVDQVQNSLPHIRAGRIKAFAITDTARVPSAPDIPSVDEAGLPGLHMTLWYGFWVPAATPPAIVAKLNAAVVDAFADPAVRARLAELELQIPSREQQTPAALAALQKAEIEKWWPIVKAAGLKPE
jgi:tripartite-type tricarboxylate transporter receptor subunit TctC